MAAEKPDFKRSLCTASVAVVLVFFSVFLLLSRQALAADETLTNLQTFVRAVGFLEEKPDPSTVPVIGIIYDPNNSRSAQNAREIKQILSAGNLGMRPHLVLLSSLDEGLGNVNFAYVAEGMQGNYGRIKKVLEAKNILSFSSDRDCVLENCCAIYVGSKDRVEIVVNKAVLDAIQTRFRPVFLMMATVI